MHWLSCCLPERVTRGPSLLMYVCRCSPRTGLSRATAVDCTFLLTGGPLLCASVADDASVLRDSDLDYKAKFRLNCYRRCYINAGTVQSLDDVILCLTPCCSRFLLILHIKKSYCVQ